MAMKTLEDLFVEELKDLYNAEQQLAEALPKMAEAASSKDLQQAFRKHTKQTEQQIGRLEEIFHQLDTKPKGPKCKGMKGIIDEGEKLIESDAEPMVKDAALVAAAQRAEHYEIACYGTVRTFAEMLGNEEAAKLLQETLEEESYTDDLLTELATKKINVGAAEH
jgi:ferritin-like metal-binding protein YciE